MLWYRLATLQHRSLQECQEETTSTEFVEWKVYLEQIHGWQEAEKLDYYLAQIAAEIRRFREGFTSNPKQVPNEDYLLKFVLKEVTEEAPEIVEEVESPRLYKEPVADRLRRARKPEPKEVETGLDLVKDPKWAAVNAIAKDSWASRLGVGKLEDLEQA